LAFKPVGGDTNLTLFHKAKKNETTLDGHVWLYKHKDFNFQLYAKEKLLQSEKEITSETNFQVRTLHPNFIFSIGVESVNLHNLFCKKEEVADAKTATATDCATSCSPSLSSWVLGGKKIDPNFALWGGFGLAFNLRKTVIDNFKVMAVGHSIKHKTKASVEGIFTRAEDPKDKTKSIFLPGVRAYVDSNALETNRVLGSVEYDTGKAELKWSLADEYKVDAKTKLKAKINEKYTVSAALIHDFSAQTKFAVVTHVDYAPKGEGKHGHLKYRFGSTLEFLDV